MRRVSRFVIAASAFAVLYLGSAALAHAEPLVFVITNPNQSGTPGQTISFAGSITNTSASAVSFGFGIGFDAELPFDPEDPNALTFAESLLSTVDPESFLFTLAPGQSVADPQLFTLIINPALTGPFPQVFNLSFLLLDPETGECVANCQEVRLTVNAPVPEPTTLVLLGAGLAGVAAKARGRRSAGR